VVEEKLTLSIWHVTFFCDEGTVYAGEKYTLQFRFEDYPLKAPEVLFIGKPPEHDQVYNDGSISLPILYRDWTSALDTSSLFMSIRNMLSTAIEKKKPETRI
jgi:ubiquitin-conjugating enzyme E2 W